MAKADTDVAYIDRGLIKSTCHGKRISISNASLDADWTHSHRVLFCEFNSWIVAWILGAMRTAIWWIRRDLRLKDNNALSAALAAAECVVPAFILDPHLLASPNVGNSRLAFLLEGLRALDSDITDAGSRLVLRKGEPLKELKALMAECQASTIFAEEDYSPYAARRDAEISGQLPLHLIQGLTVRHPEAVVKPDGKPYTVYTPYKRAWKALPLPDPGEDGSAPGRIASPETVPSEPFPTQPRLSQRIPFIPGEAQAERRLRAFVDGAEPPIYRYANDRNRMVLAGTSELSPYLRFGMLSARQAVLAANQAIEASTDDQQRHNAETWLDELIWREFYIAIQHHFPSVRHQSFRPDLRNLPWRNDMLGYSAWCEGRTGYPIVDAAMRQLKDSGWMHNRGRMIAASFLVKDLLIDWRQGEQWFMQHLVDGDPAANNGGWQWTAGTGTDAAPYFRVFNPTLQGKKFDPDGAYIRRWLPELGRVPDRFIHEPWQMQNDVQKDAGCIIGQDYPSPIVDHAWARERALEVYRQARSD
jgi:deoxyribodipyrimidine photo-lyase